MPRSAADFSNRAQLDSSGFMRLCFSQIIPSFFSVRLSEFTAMLLPLNCPAKFPSIRLVEALYRFHIAMYSATLLRTRREKASQFALRAGRRVRSEYDLNFVRRRHIAAIRDLK